MVYRATSPQQVKRLASQRRFTDDIATHLSSRPGRVCIVVDGLLGLSGSEPRLKCFIQQQKAPVTFIITYANSPKALRHVNAGLYDGQFFDGRYFAFVHSDEIIASTPSVQIHHLFTVMEEDLLRSQGGTCVVHVGDDVHQIESKVKRFGS